MSLKTGYLSLLGLPNAGKSSLLNALVGEKIAIVSPKEQTTWNIQRGFVVRDNLHFVVTDSPGLQEGTIALNQAIGRNSFRVLKDVLRSDDTSRELLAFVIDGPLYLKRLKNRQTTGHENLKETFTKAVRNLPTDIPVAIILNKCDLLSRDSDREILKENVYATLQPVFSNIMECFFLSTKTREGIEELLFFLEKRFPEGSEEIFDSESLTDSSMRDLTEEILREKCFLRLGAELPYSIAVEIEEFNESRPELTSIRVILHVERESQKAIVIGKGGEKLKELGSLARVDLERLLQKKVFLSMKVKVSSQWSRDNKLVERFGYDKFRHERTR